MKQVSLGRAPITKQSCETSNMRIALLLAVLTSTGSAVAASSGAKTDRIQSIHIELTSFGLGGSAKESLDLIPKGRDFVLSGERTEEEPLSDKAHRSAVKQRIMSGEPIRALVAAVSAPAVNRAAGIAQLTSPEWLTAHAAEAYDALTPDGACSTEARQLFVTRYKNPSAAVLATNAYYDTEWTDDYPSAKVSVTYSDGTSTAVESRSQHAFMLPWKIGKTSTWNPAIANALLKVLPDSSEHKGRFAAQAMVPDVARAVLKPIESQWENLEGRCKYKALIAKIEPHFDVLDVFHTGPGFSGTLHNASMPRNLVIDVRLPGENTREAKIAFDRFLKQIPNYIEVARPFVNANPAIGFELWYSEGRSFNFEDDEVYGDEKAVEFLRRQPQKNKGVLLRQQGVMRGREWIVLPGGKSVVWNEPR